MTDPLCLMSVHAHPDDESSKGAGTVARYHDQSVRTVLVTCTGGEAGDILNPAMDRPEIRDNLAAVRREELAQASKIIGYDEVVLLGYRDSGMPDTPANADPRSFAAAPLEEAVGRLVGAIRRWQPQVLVTYHEDQSGYPHPDHLRVHDISIAAFDAAGDADAYPDAGAPWEVAKLYYHVWSRRRFIEIHERFLALGLESPFEQRFLDRPGHDEDVTTSIDISGYAGVRADALRAHATQVDPNSPFWFGTPAAVTEGIRPFDDYILARSRVASTLPEDDLFAGVPGRSPSGAR